MPVKDFSVRVGSEILEAGGEVIKVSKVINHPSFNAYTFDFDFSILTLARNIVVNGVSKAIIPLPPANQAIADGSQVFVTGWGYTLNPNESINVLRGVVVQTTNQASCNKVYLESGGITANMVCAASPGKDSCNVS